MAPVSGSCAMGISFVPLAPNPSNATVLRPTVGHVSEQRMVSQCLACMCNEAKRALAVWHLRYSERKDCNHADTATIYEWKERTL